ncbi:hypothetical protein COX08_00720 [Candidatus Beckwithbacteria bacterium CG23_combo_of_CG06-09_8_20_14_all_34_8]|uniref:TrbC/VIRB2 family protein n=1 Tax=Candidatus Beckwithbacteria bacterium CG23_combo_of_CG06-09_8_20_14_all_34_8 TaxID=1974497 RepID=A0A2H0B8V9_9BACT|nr:MAG: hypothetical protein COX08_00720 [Candidatus Beckwithbacteria bacterium CG23_combo_of_CG06-09_8_20_14_all_34_8]
MSKKLSSFVLISWLLIPKLVLAANTWSDPSGDDPAKFSDIEVIFSNVIGVLIPFAGVAIFIMILIGGFKYLTSAGDPKATASAGQTITWAIVGLLFLIGAWLVLVFIKQITGIDVTLFEVPKN